MRLFAKLLNDIASYRNYRTTLSQLSGLSDHMLADIGLSRNEVNAVAISKAKTDEIQIPITTSVGRNRIIEILPVNANSAHVSEIRHIQALPKAA